MSRQRPIPRKRRRSLQLPAIALVVAAQFPLGCRAPEAIPAGLARLDSSEIAESSGLVASRQFPGIFWTHNDSADSPRLFAVTPSGTLVRTVHVEGAENVDWEAIAADDAGHLYIGDIGNNANRRRDLKVYRVREPDPYGEERTTVEVTLPFRYPEQKRFPDRNQRNFDGEALFWARGELYLVTKHRSDTRAVLYRFPRRPPPESAASLVRVGELDLGQQRNPPPEAAPGRWLSWRRRNDFAGMATGAAATTDGNHLALLSYHALFLFQRPEQGDDYLSRPLARIDFDETVTLQCEAVAWAGADLLFTNEQGALHRIEAPLERPPATYP